MRKRVRNGILCSVALSLMTHAAVKAAVIYQDSFTGGTPGTAIGGNTLPGDTGLAGGTANATWQANTTTSTNPDAIWTYSSSGATIVSPNGTTVRDTGLIANAYLPFSPQAGFVYDLQATLIVPSASGDTGHWSGLTFAGVENGGTGGGSSALSNDQPTGLIIDRDDLSNGYDLNIFEGANGGTNGQANFVIAGGVGSAVTLDEILNTTAGLSAETLSWEINGTIVGGPVLLSGNPAINYVVFGDDTAPATTVSNFSLTTVPEPTAMGAIAAMGLLLGRRRTRRA